MQLLKGHISRDTAYVSKDYPYGYGLRCRKRWWIECKPPYGYRLVTQTSDPRRDHAWNRPRLSGYARYGMALYLDDQGRCHCAALDDPIDLPKFGVWLNTYGAGVPGRGEDAA